MLWQYLKLHKKNRKQCHEIEEVLAGIRKIVKNDLDALKQGISLFDLLHDSKSNGRWWLWASR
jgi:hypothetical protein